ncbi:hypothetical protein ES703_09840 [subsurface metagenome]
MMSETELRKIIEASNMVLNVCDGAFTRDEEGYDIFDAGHFRGFLNHPDIFGVKDLTPEEVEWMRRKLLRYKKQLQKMGLDASILDKPVHPVAFFAHAQDWEGRRLRVSPHSLAKFDKGLAEQLKEVEKRGGWVQLKVGYYRDRPLKWLWIRFNDPDENGKTRKWWEKQG